VRLAPVRVLRLGGEETAPSRTAGQLTESRSYLLIEARFVAERVDEFEARHDGERSAAGKVEFKDRAVVARQVHQAFDRMSGLEVEQVAD
jgi:hypothetical protein